jgi:hypothetical protein
MKDTAGVGVEPSQIYSSGRRSHHPNGAPRPAKPNPRSNNMHPYRTYVRIEEEQANLRACVHRPSSPLVE